MVISLISAIGLSILGFVLTRHILASILIGIVTYLLVYFGLPTLSYGFYEIPFLITIFGVVVTVLISNKEYKNPILLSIGSGICLFGLSFLVIIPFFTTPIWMGHSKEYRVLLSDNNVDESGVFANDVDYIDTSQVRLVDQSLAVKLAETKLGEDPGLGSRVKIGHMRIQSVNGKLYWVGPLEWSGFFKWFFGDSGTPGYVAVSAFNQRDVRLIQKLNDNRINLELGEGAFFGDYIMRYIWDKGYATVPFTDPTFEVDDNWKPYWVITKYKRGVGYSGNIATGVIIVDPQTRKITDYTIDDAPDWVDRIQPEDFIAAQIDYWGELVHGFWSNFENKDKLKHTPGISLVYGSDGRAKWYTGIQSTGSDQGTTGFMLVDTRTGKAKYYKQSGITEEACKRNILGLVAEKPGWSVTNCILYNVGGHPTYIAIIKDADGNPKQIGMASVINRDVVVSNPQIQGALRAFRSELRGKGNIAGVDNKVKQLITKGIVVRFGIEVLEGNTYYYLVLDSEPNKVFLATTNLNSYELPITKIGDLVKVYYDDSGRSISDMTNFDNMNITLQKSKSQKEIEKYQKN